MEMAEETDHDSIKPELMELENCNTENVTYDSIDEGKMISQSADVGITGEISLLEEIQFPKGLARSSSAFVIGANNKFPVNSRYLSASVGSCHDTCKSGHKHLDPEKKIRRPLVGPTRETQPLTRTSSDSVVRAVLSEGTKKKIDDRHGSISCSTLEKNYPERDINHLKFKHIQSEIKPSLVVASMLRNGNDPQKGKKIVGRSSSLVENMIPKVKEVKSKPKKESVSREKEKAEEKAKEPMNAVSPHTPLKKSSGIKARLYKNIKDTSHIKKPSVSNEASKFGPSTNKRFVKKASKVASPNEASPSILRRPQVRKNKDSKDDQTDTQNGPSSSCLASELVLTPSIKETQLKSKPVINPKVARKIKSEDGSRTNSPKRTIPKRRGSLPEEKDDSAWKLKFKRETAVALQGSNSDPRKLKFKRSEVRDDDENDRGGEDGIVCELNHNNDTGNEPSDVKVEPGKVQLRHQEASGKKDSVDMNNVIEEAATKLAMTRKSKVKALVGAFESVMSVRDRKSVMEASAL